MSGERGRGTSWFDVFREIDLLALDVDGVLTDGRLYYVKQDRKATTRETDTRASAGR
jgi:3-deoxy-D-manno-octulosonate 8-phosphate phosphatase KdsC-like HAD superfamily phosphatase